MNSTAAQTYILMAWMALMKHSRVSGEVRAVIYRAVPRDEILLSVTKLDIAMAFWVYSDKILLILAAYLTLALLGSLVLNRCYEPTDYSDV